MYCARILQNYSTFLQYSRNKCLFFCRSHYIEEYIHLIMGCSLLYVHCVEFILNVCVTILYIQFRSKHFMFLHYYFIIYIYICVGTYKICVHIIYCIMYYCISFYLFSVSFLRIVLYALDVYVLDTYFLFVSISIIYFRFNSTNFK